MMVKRLIFSKPILRQDSANQCRSNAGKPPDFIFKKNKPYQTNILCIIATLFKPTFFQHLKTAKLKSPLNEFLFLNEYSCASVTHVSRRFLFYR
jgi:hypothetical protein